MKYDFFRFHLIFLVFQENCKTKKRNILHKTKIETASISSTSALRVIIFSFNLPLKNDFGSLCQTLLYLLFFPHHCKYMTQWQKKHHHWQLWRRLHVRLRREQPRSSCTNKFVRERRAQLTEPMVRVQLTALFRSADYFAVHAPERQKVRMMSSHIICNAFCILFDHPWFNQQSDQQWP